MMFRKTYRSTIPSLSFLFNVAIPVVEQLTTPIFSQAKIQATPWERPGSKKKKKTYKNKFN